jgi:hypothetical protein
MSSELVETLRRVARCTDTNPRAAASAELLDEAADRLEAVEATLEAAHKYLDTAQWWHGDHYRAVKDVLAILDAAFSPEPRTIPAACPHCGHRHPPDGMCV